MAKGVSTIFQTVDSTNWDYKQNHHRCRNNQTFPTLSTIVEVEVEDLVEEEIVLNDDQSSTAAEIDPDNAEAGSHEPGWEKKRDDSDFDSDVDAGECEATGIAFTLKKIDYICQRIASLPQKQAEWNIAYESRNRAYGARKVIKQLLENELDKYTGRSADGHHLKSYELLTKEWEDINDLNQVLKAAHPNSPTEIQIQSESNEDGNSPKSDPELNAYNFFPIVPEAKQINTELQRYNNGAFPMDKKGCVLGWWKVHSKDFPILASLARDYLACAASSATVELTFLAAAQDGKDIFGVPESD
ncbi:hypothetical protein PCANC_10479 [Puccinia coronata f. sp. avenae]|uniref:HAT C-terminal dimerisation domain-containing protein n=1 Tax=Puccinia coronata f. sp. avenae TaxID=200324 RepID=A0A2N5VIA4_9BASI|nr:hypothetical protein PCANC_10479 [Puccinia coronata f. sp. avenae]